MSIHNAKQAAEKARTQALSAAGISDERKPRTDETRIETELAYAVANLADAFLEFLKVQKN